MLHSSRVLSLAIGLFNVINGQTIDDYPCSFEILSDDHAFGAAHDGRYFNYNVEDVECVLGSPLIQSSTYDVFYSGCNCIRSVVMWNTANGGSIGDGHGRVDPIANSNPNDWATGGFIAFDGINMACGCNPTREPTPRPTPEPTPEPTDNPTSAPTDCRCSLSLQEYVDICYCGEDEEEISRQGLNYFEGYRDEYYNKNNGDIDNDGYVKISLPVSAFYIVCFLAICGAVSLFTVSMNMIKKCMNDGNNVKFSKVINYSDTEDEQIRLK